MKTLVVYYSKSGHSRKVAEKAASSVNGDLDEIKFDEASHTVKAGKNPAKYGRVILCCPIHAFNLPEPMKLYLERNKEAITDYRLAVTCMLGGLKFCESTAAKILGKKPAVSIKINGGAVAGGKYDLKKILS